MKESVASTTALITSLMRALHTRTDPLQIINDPWGDQLVPKSAIEALRQRIVSAMPESTHPTADTTSESIVDSWLRANAAYPSVIVRSRYTEDALHAAIVRGVKQYVLIGAGFDSYALRRPAEARQLEIFEIDHPATQSLKKQRLAECGTSVLDSVQFLAADLSKEGLGVVLSNSTFRATEPTFFSWLGVTMYLTREANMASLHGIAQCGAPESEVVFTYLDQDVFSTDSKQTSSSFTQLQQSVSSMGEPFLSGFDPGTLAHDLQCANFHLEEDLDDIQMVDRYDHLGTNELQPTARSRIARARIVADMLEATPNETN